MKSGFYKKTLFGKLRNYKSIWLIIVAAFLLELLAVVQYYTTKNLIEKELELLTESELRLKAVLIKSTLNSTEKTLNNYSSSVHRFLNEPDSMYSFVKDLVSKEPNVVGAEIAFAPYFYPSKGELFEPHAKKNGDSIIVDQVASNNHDYRQREFYQKVAENGKLLWSEPYLDEAGTNELITTCSMPIYNKDSFAGVFAVDVNLEWLGDTINARHYYPSSFSMLLTESGNIISRPSLKQKKNLDADHVANLINDSTVIRIKSQTGHTNIIDFTSLEQNDKGTIYYAPMKGFPKWQIAYVCYDKEVFAKLNNQLYLMIGLLLFTIAVLGFIIYRLSKSESKLVNARISQEKINSELRIANDIQQAMLPISEPNIEERDDIEICGSLLPAKEVGGDLFDYFIRNDKLFVCIGDVSGKGVPSALIMAVIHGLFRSLANREDNPSIIMKELNEYSYRNNTKCIFVTMFIGVLDLPTGRFRYCNAGHDKPLIIGSDKPLDVTPNLPIGVLPDMKYQMQERTLERGTTLFLYTDGITEAKRQDKKMFGLERLSSLLSECQSLKPKDIVERVNVAVSNFISGAEQSDDLTMLVLCYKPTEHTILLDEHIELDNDISEVKTLNSFISSIAEKMNIEKSTLNNIKLATEEAVVNVMEYAYPPKTKGKISVRALAEENVIKIIITDNGKPFNPTESMKADTTLSAEERPIGGLGILLVLELMDIVNYEYVDNKNVLTLTKRYTTN